MEAKSKTIETYQRHDKDTGSADVQVAILTKKILSLTEHLKINNKDFSSRRGYSFSLKINLDSGYFFLLDYLRDYFLSTLEKP